MPTRLSSKNRRGSGPNEPHDDSSSSMGWRSAVSPNQMMVMMGEAAKAPQSNSKAMPEKTRQRPGWLSSLSGSCSSGVRPDCTSTHHIRYIAWSSRCISDMLMGINGHGYPSRAAHMRTKHLPLGFERCRHCLRLRLWRQTVRHHPVPAAATRTLVEPHTLEAQSCHNAMRAQVSRTACERRRGAGHHPPERGWRGVPGTPRRHRCAVPWSHGD